MAENNGHDNKVIDTTDTAIVVRIAGQAGPRAIEMSFGVPLQMNLLQLNSYMDKVTSVIDRQIAIGDLRKAKIDLEGAEKALASHLEHKASFEQSAMQSWESRGRRGPFKLTDSQLAQMGNFNKTIAELRDQRIPYFRDEIAKLERAVQLEG